MNKQSAEVNGSLTIGWVIGSIGLLVQMAAYLHYSRFC